MIAFPYERHVEREHNYNTRNGRGMARGTARQACDGRRMQHDERHTDGPARQIARHGVLLNHTRNGTASATGVTLNVKEGRKRRAAQFMTQQAAHVTTST